ncbi:hypothetical protein ACNKHM_15905 [Shigella sonnei]
MSLVRALQGEQGVVELPTLKATVVRCVCSLNRCCWVKTAWKSVKIGNLSAFEQNALEGMLDT